MAQAIHHAEPRYPILQPRRADRSTTEKVTAFALAVLASFGSFMILPLEGAIATSVVLLTALCIYSLKNRRANQERNAEREVFPIPFSSVRPSASAPLLSERRDVHRYQVLPQEDNHVPVGQGHNQRGRSAPRPPANRQPLPATARAVAVSMSRSDRLPHVQVGRGHSATQSAGISPRPPGGLPSAPVSRVQPAVLSQPANPLPAARVPVGRGHSVQQNPTAPRQQQSRGLQGAFQAAASRLNNQQADAPQPSIQPPVTRVPVGRGHSQQE